MDHPRRIFWGKFKPGEMPRHGVADGARHPLADHCADVSAVAEALLTRTLLGRRLAGLGGLEEFCEGQVARLGVLAAIHDFGKCNRGFQEQLLPGKPRVGHVVPAVELIDWHCRDFAASKVLYDALLGVGFDGWFESDSVALQMLVATVCHHGRPYLGSVTLNHRLWEVSSSIEPLAGLRSLITDAVEWFPQASNRGVAPLPTEPAFQHGWNGVLTLADWLGSDEQLFPFSQEGDGERMPRSRRWAATAVREVGLDVSKTRTSLRGRQPSLATMLGRDVAPRPLQREIVRIPPADGGSCVVVEATTGEGKTEAALLHFLRLFEAGQVDGLYFALPTRAAASQIYGRVQHAIGNVFPPEGRPAVLQAIPGYAVVDGVEGKLLPEFEVQWPDDWQDDMRRRAWAAERSKRFLAGCVVVGTIDQVLLSALSVKHSHLRAAPLLRHLLVVDEVHASDAYMTRILERVLEHQRAAGGHALLLSATLGGVVRERLLHLDRKRTPDLESCLSSPYPALSSNAGDAPVPVSASSVRRVLVEPAPIMEDEPAVARRALDAAESGAHVLVLRNTVKGAVATQQALEELAASRGAQEHLFRAEGVVAPHHSRFAAVDRRILDRAVESEFQPKRTSSRGVVLVATQTVEQSLDLDADLLLADLCPIDVLLQRIGRLHRHQETVRPHGFEKARVLVLVPANRDLSDLLQEDGTARGAHGLGSVYPDLRILEATWRQLEAKRRLEIPADCRRLVEECTHPEALRGISDQSEPWRRHGEKVWGSERAKGQAADSSEMDWSVPFGELDFKEASETIRTRLGEEDVRLKFEPPLPIGPFGQPVPELTLRHYQVPQGVDLSTDRPQSIQALESGGFQFRFAAGAFTCDRLGIRVTADD